MNIQQALNRGLLAGGTSLYFAGQTLEQNRQSAVAEHQAATENLLKKTEEYKEAAPSILQQLENEGLTHEEALKELPNSPQKKELDIAGKQHDRATTKLHIFAPERYKDYKELSQTKMNWYIRQLAAEERALQGQMQNQSTYTNQKQAIDKRINMLKSGSYKSRMHQPSVRMEE